MSHIYWKGKCELCKYSKDFSMSFGTWTCDLYKKIMCDIKYCRGPYTNVQAPEGK